MIQDGPGHVARKGEMRNTQKVLVGNMEGNRPRRRQVDDIR
jgi:hypothetical protein